MNPSAFVSQKVFSGLYSHMARVCFYIISSFLQFTVMRYCSDDVKRYVRAAGSGPRRLPPQQVEAMSSRSTEGRNVSALRCRQTLTCAALAWFKIALITRLNGSISLSTNRQKNTETQPRTKHLCVYWEKEELFFFFLTVLLTEQEFRFVCFT